MTCVNQSQSYLVAKEGFMASWTINIIQMIFKFGEDTPWGTIGP